MVECCCWWNAEGCGGYVCEGECADEGWEGWEAHVRCVVGLVYMGDGGGCEGGGR